MWFNIMTELTYNKFTRCKKRCNHVSCLLYPILNYVMIVKARVCLIEALKKKKYDFLSLIRDGNHVSALLHYFSKAVVLCDQVRGEFKAQLNTRNI